MKISILLKNIGFSDKDIKIYIVLLKLGNANMQAIANETGLPRSTIYTRIKKLSDFGAVDVFQKKRTRYYMPVAPEKLVNITRKHAEELEDNINLFKVLSNKTKISKAKIKLFEEVEGVKLILNDILNESRSFLAIVSIQDMQSLAQDYFELFIDRRIKNRLRVKLITNESKESQYLKAKDGEELRTTRFTTARYNFNTATYIYGNKIAILSLKEKPMVGVIIEDESMANTHKMYFEFMWENLR